MAVSVLFNEPKLLKFNVLYFRRQGQWVSVLFNEPKLLKFKEGLWTTKRKASFSALQRAEIAEICTCKAATMRCEKVSVLFNEPKLLKFSPGSPTLFQRTAVSVLFNEPKLLKFIRHDNPSRIASSRDIFGCSKNRQNRIVENSTYPLDDFGFR